MKSAATRAPFDRSAPALHDLQRWVSLATASALMAFGITRRSAPGFFLAAAAAPLAYRGWTGEWPLVGRTHAAADVHESIRLEKPLDEVIQFWRQGNQLPSSLRDAEVKFSTVRNGRSSEVTLVGRRASHRIREDLRHVKQMVEAGEIPVATRVI